MTERFSLSVIHLEMCEEEGERLLEHKCLSSF